jgi:hypothetical protein
MEFPAGVRRRYRQLAFLMYGARLFLRLTSRKIRGTSGLTLRLTSFRRNIRRSLACSVGKPRFQNAELAGWDIYKRYSHSVLFEGVGNSGIRLKAHSTVSDFYKQLSILREWLAQANIAPAFP